MTVSSTSSSGMVQMLQPNRHNALEVVEVKCLGFLGDALLYRHYGRTRACRRVMLSMVY